MAAETPEWLRSTRQQLEGGTVGARAEIASERHAALYDARARVLPTGFYPARTLLMVLGRPVQAPSHKAKTPPVHHTGRSRAAARVVAAEPVASGVLDCPPGSQGHVQRPYVPRPCERR